ncbi:2862_t:CDS:2 [Scutellospora calospora]|uniref:2862_t:CDS:1 n=1 Tax=Scutellospora calospora TaxID=85575 RepID=A0ACA9JYN1_9GLOM|nr:2862_t:CDS:2 [Scutellospora calospora]
MRRQRINRERKVHNNKQFPLSLLQTFLFFVIDWNEFWKNSITKYSRYIQDWKNGEQIKRYSNPFMLMKQYMAYEIKNNIDLKNLNSIFKLLEHDINNISEILVGIDDLRLILGKSSFNNLNLIRSKGEKFEIRLSGCSNQELITITVDNLKTLLNCKIDGIDISIVGGRAWMVAKPVQRKKYSGLDLSHYNNGTSAQTPSLTNDMTNRNLSENNNNTYIINRSNEINNTLSPKILFEGDINERTLNIEYDEHTETIETMKIISSQGYVPVWKSSNDFEPLTFDKTSIGEKSTDDFEPLTFVETDETPIGEKLEDDFELPTFDETPIGVDEYFNINDD